MTNQSPPPPREQTGTDRPTPRRSAGGGGGRAEPARRLPNYHIMPQQVFFPLRRAQPAFRGAIQKRRRLSATKRKKTGNEQPTSFYILALPPLSFSACSLPHPNPLAEPARQPVAEFGKFCLFQRQFLPVGKFCPSSSTGNSCRPAISAPSPQPATLARFQIPCHFLPAILAVLKYG